MTRKTHSKVVRASRTLVWRGTEALGPELVRHLANAGFAVRDDCLLLEKGERGEANQIGSGQSVSVERVLQILIGLSSKPVRVVVDPSRVRRAEALEFCEVTHKAEQAVGWKP